MEDDQELRSFVASYQEHLQDLKHPTKAAIAALTMLATEQAQSSAMAAALSAVVENHIVTCAPPYRLPALYLMDSIVKNCPAVFKPLFERNLPQMFFAAWDEAPEKTRASLKRLLGTWVPVFNAAVLDTVHARLHPQRLANVAPLAQQSLAHAGAFPPYAGQYQQQPQYPPQQQYQQDYNAQIAPSYSQYPQYNTYNTAGTNVAQTPAYGYPEYTQHPAQMQHQQQVPAMQHTQQAAPQQPAGLSQQMLSLLQGLQHGGFTPPLEKEPSPAPSLAAKFAPGSFETARLKAKDDTVLQQLEEKSKLARAKNLDRLFLHRQRMRQASDNSRKWFVPVEVWLLGATANMAADFATGQDFGEEGATAAVEYSVPVDPSQPSCAITGEKFQEVWDVKSQDWHYKGAKRVTDDEAKRWKIPPGSLVLASAMGSTPVLGNNPPSPLRDGKAAVKRLRALTPPITADVAGNAKRVKTEGA